MMKLEYDALGSKVVKSQLLLLRFRQRPCLLSQRLYQGVDVNLLDILREIRRGPMSVGRAHH
jgi:hypothetical protein